MLLLNRLEGSRRTLIVNFPQQVLKLCSESSIILSKLIMEKLMTHKVKICVVADTVAEARRVYDMMQLGSGYRFVGVESAE